MPLTKSEDTLLPQTWSFFPEHILPTNLHRENLLKGQRIYFLVIFLFILVTFLLDYVLILFSIV